MNPQHRISIILPAYNEAGTIGDIVCRIKTAHPDYEIIVVDDGSSDQTGPAAAEAGAVVIRHPYNIGNGAAVKTGIRNAGGDILVFMDSDGQHDPKDIDRLIAPMDRFDMTVAMRGNLQHATIGRAIGNLIYNTLASYVAKFSIQDLTSGFRAVRASIVRQFLYLIPNTYSYPTTLTLAVLRSGRSVQYVPLTVNRRKTGKSSIKPFKDGVRFLMIIIKICTLYSPLRIFLPVSALLFLIGMAYYLYTFVSFNRFTNMSALLMIAAMLVFMMGLISEQICQMRYERSETDENKP